MSIFRRILGLLVMIAGILGLVLSLAGLVGVWVFKPNVTSFIDDTFTTLNTSVDTSQDVTVISGQALGATIDSLDALNVMLESTASSVDETKPVMDQVKVFLGDALPDTLLSASESLRTAQEAAVVLENTIQQLETFQILLGSVPMMSAFINVPEQSYAPEVALADSLGELATSLEEMPEMFTSISTSLEDTDDNLVTIETSLVAMTSSVDLISQSLASYQVMITQSGSSMDSLKTSLNGIQTQMDNILKWAAIGLSIGLFWLLMAQVVILSQGWELYRGTAGRMESGAVQTTDETPTDKQDETPVDEQNEAPTDEQDETQADEQDETQADEQDETQAEKQED